jgi:hypothetical protein
MPFEALSSGSEFCTWVDIPALAIMVVDPFLRSMSIDFAAALFAGLAGQGRHQRAWALSVPENCLRQSWEEMEQQTCKSVRLQINIL